MDVLALHSAPSVWVDIKPEISINCNNEKGAIAVAILSTDDSDATTWIRPHEEGHILGVMSEGVGFDKRIHRGEARQGKEEDR